MKTHCIIHWLNRHSGRSLMAALIMMSGFLSFHCQPLSAQILPDYSVVEGVDPVTLVQQVLIGQGVETSNITYQGVIDARGSFYGESNLGINSGIILTSGRASYSEGPNNAASKGYDNTASGDIDLNTLSGGNTQDAAVLEFDFIPQSNIVEFKYVFGSEEYPDYANSAYNDVFGFFISGPGISGGNEFTNDAKNIAILPVLAFPQIYVSINNINNGTSNNGPCENCEYYVNNGTGNTPSQNPYIQYDGFTTVLVARSPVVPCSTYHIKLVVADIGDGAYDSGVFLEANSFSSVGLGANVAFSHATVDTAVEACNNASVAFELFQITPVDYTINLEIGGTAINGVDYEFIPDEIIIPMGDTMAVLEIIPIDDGLYENITETITIIYNSSLCGVDMDTLTLYVKDYPQFFSGVTPDQTIECNEILTLEAYGYGGVEPYYYQWSTGETTETITVSPPVSQQYTVTITDECGSQREHTINVNVQGPIADLGAEEVNICLYDAIDLTVQGGTAWYWMPGGETTQTITVSPLVNTTYSATAFDDCGNFSSDEILVTVGQPFADAGPDGNICTGGSITLTANDTPNGIWLWTDMLSGDTYTGREITVSPATTRQYCVDVTDNCGNTLTDCLMVNVFQLTADAGTDPVICAGQPAELTGVSSTGNGLFTWTDGVNTYTGQTVQVMPAVTTTYTLTVNDGCEAMDDVTVNVNPLPVVTAAASSGSICPDEQITLSASGAVSYVWSADQPDNILAGHENEQNPVAGPLANTNYTVTATDANNCVNTAMVSVAVKERMFADFVLSGNAVCEGDEITVTYTGNGQSYATYDWSWDGGVTATTGQGPHQVSWTGAGPRTISLTVTQLGCQSTEVVAGVEVNPMPVADFTSGITSGCIPLTVDFTDVSSNTAPGVSYNWDFGAAGSSLLQHVSQEFGETGNFDVTLTVTNPGGCIDQKTVNALVETWPLPVADFEATPMNTSLKNPTIDFLSNASGDNIVLQWNTGDGTIYTTPQFSHTYTTSDYFDVSLLVTNSFGCVDSLHKEVYVSPKYMLLIPSAFTPNGDGRNDKFVVKGSGVKEYRINIYNRWGALIFTSGDINESWDGKVNGAPANSGIYLYRTFFRDENDETSEQMGSINLMY